MYKNRGNSWIGFEEAQRKINALKEEVEIAEKKLSFAKKSFTFENNQSFDDSLKTEDSEVLNQKDSRNFIKKNGTKKLPFEKHVRKKRKYSKTDKSVNTSNDMLDSLHSTSSKSLYIHSPDPDIKQTLVKSVIGSTSSHLPSAETTDFLFNLKHKVTSSERTSSLIADTYKNANAELSNIIFRNEPTKIEDSSKISFTSWEEEFLRREIDLGSTEVESSHHEVSDTGNAVEGIHWSPVISGTEVRNLKPKRIIHGHMKTLQEIINRQKKFHEKIQAKSDLDGISSSNYRKKQILNDYGSSDAEKHEEDMKISEKIDDGIDATVPFRLPPTRKKCLVTNFPKYRGFNVPGAASSRKNFKSSKSYNVKENKSPAMKRIKKTVSDKKESISAPLLKKNKQTVFERSEDNSERLTTLKSNKDNSEKQTILKSSEDNSKAKQLHEQKVSDNSVSSSQKSSTVDSSSSVRPEEASQSKSDAVPKASDVKQEEKKITTSTLIDMSSDSESEFLSDKSKENQIPKQPLVSKSVKRKAKNIAEEKMAPSPKIRHYDPQTVRDYIKKKKAERRKRHLEEHKKSLQEAQRRKESLQKLYEFQKQKIVSAFKSSSPIKVVKKQREFTSQGVKQSSLNTYIFPDLKKAEANEIVCSKYSKQLEKPPTYPLVETANDFIPKESLGTQTSRNHSESEKSKLNSPDISQLVTNITEQKVIVVSNSETSVKKDLHLAKDNRLFLKDDKNQSLQKELPSPSFYKENENLTSYLSTISTPSQLSELDDVQNVFSEALKYDKIVIPTGQSKQVETLKNLVKSIDEMTAPFEHLIRTRKWVEESPPPPNPRSSRKSLITNSNKQAENNSQILKEVKIDFVIEVEKSLQGATGNSFRKQVTNIGDTSQLYEKLLGQSAAETSSTRKENGSLEEKLIEDVKKSGKQATGVSYEAELIEGSLKSEEEISHEYNLRSLQPSLIEGTLKSEDNTMISENSVSSSNQHDIISSSKKLIQPFIEGTNFNPDPFNFINTFNRKPLGIPEFSKDMLKAVQNQVSSSQDMDASEQDQFSEQVNSTNSLNGSFVSEETHSHTAVNSSILSKQVSNSDDNGQKENSNENISHKSSSPSTSFKSTNSSVLSESHSMKNAQSTSFLEEQIESKNDESEPKGVSASESSVSEIISVIKNSKNGEIDSILSNKSHKSSDDKISSEGNLVENKKSDNDIPESPLVLDDKISSNNSIHDLIEEVSSISEELQEVSKESSQIFHSDKKSDDKSFNQSSSEKSSKDREAVSDQNKMDSVSSFPPSSHNSVTIDFSQPVRFTLSNGVSKSLKVNKGVPLHEEQYFHTQVVTRVASEAAAAAATSAVIAVFETQKELLSKVRGASNHNVLTNPFSEILPNHSSSNSISSHKTSSSNSVSTVIESSQSKSPAENSGTDEININPNIGSKEDRTHSEDAENISEHFSGSNKMASSSVISEDLPVSEDSKELHKQRLRKISGNLSSPSPASLSENESLSTISFMRINSPPSSSTITESVLSDDSFAQLTLDVVRKITLEEEMRASQQLALLKFQEQTLVENARAAMAWLESLKKNFREKGANKKASFIKRKQKDIILRLRQERAQLRCMQEAYRSICEKHHSLEMDKKKLLNEPSQLPYQMSKKKDISHSSKASSQQKTKDFVKQKSDSSSTSAVLTEEELKQSVEEIPEEMLEITKNEASNSSQGSILEVVASEPAVSSASSHSKSHDITSVVSLPQLKQGHSQSSLSLHSNNSGESAVQGLKKLEASKRHLTKREQRILQRRKHVEKILQWQMKLDSEELAVRELEQKAVELVDTSKKKAKYYISSSSSALPEEKEKFSSSDIPEEPINHTDSMRVSASSDSTSSKRVSTDEVPEFEVPSDSVPEENIVTATSGDSIEEELSKKGTNEQESSGALSSSSVHEVNENQSVESSIKTADDTQGTSHTEEIATNGRSSSPKSSTIKKSTGSDNYSESFESSASQKDSPPVPSSSAVKSSLPSTSNRKEKNFSIKAPLAPRSFRRHDSSGSDDSYTISHSETASDQSDIEVRIHALAEELRRRKYEAEKLKREQKRKYREHLKGTELSLQKQVEAYTQYIQQVKSDLEQMEALSSQLQTVDISIVKPQIKWPRPEHTADSRRIRKQASISAEPLTPEKKSIDNASSSPDSLDSSIDLSHKRGKPVIKKLFPDSKEKLKHEIATNKETSIKTVTSENISEKELLYTKTSKSKSASAEFTEKELSVEGNEKDISAVSENLEISTSNKSSSIHNEIQDKLSAELKEESEIEEESYESINSSLMTVDSKSEQSQVYTNNADSKSTYQSDTFVSSSSMLKTDQETNNKDNDVKSSSIPDIIPSSNDTARTESCSKITKESLTTGHPVNSDSAPSSEIEYNSESSNSTNSASGKDEFESGSFEYEHSDTNPTLSPRNLLDKTFTVEEEKDVISSSKNKLAITESKSLSQINEEKNDELAHVVPNKDKKSLKEGLKSETFVVNVVSYLYSSVVEDAIRTMLNLSKKYPSKTKLPSPKTKILSDVSCLPVKKLSAESMELFINELLSTYINDAISSVINISKSYKNFENVHIQSDEFPSTTSISCALTSTGTDSLQAASNSQIQNTENPIENKSIQSIHDKSDYNIFKKQTDWFEDGFVAAQWDTQQLEQQLILQQYPYYYRKIPNKPPPPYTPPAVMSINSQYSYPLPIKKEKPIEKTDSIKYVTKHISPILDCIAETLLIGKKNGLMVSEIKDIDFSSVVKQLDITAPSHLVFLDLIFDLTKEIALDTFSETNEVPEPWLRPKRLTPKPKFPMDKNVFISSLQKKVEEALKLVPAESFSGLKRKRPTWSEMKLGRKKRDFVDTILISEIKEEEPEWVNYDQDEVTVKFQIADSIFDYLVNDTVNLIKDLKKKSYLFIGNMT
ncbi:centrosome-associated protein 350-like [Argiope bruennichi]|uniref:centrosome-associated protein 350-like n=1 Tax=Argiope bruennichi TaxID=94029 RepID=UPI0024948EB0|nr:centrosome-associated protein 350-like [Argiope bruennichi]